MKSITEFLEQTANTFPDKTAFRDDQTALTYRELVQRAKSIGSALLSSQKRKTAVAIYLNKTPMCAAAMMGVAYSGNFYVVVDPKMPLERIRNIFSVVQPFAVIAEEQLLPQLGELTDGLETFVCEQAARTEIDDAGLLAVHHAMTDTDPLYCLFTSGSTGVPKGTVVSHRNVISYTDWVISTFSIDDKTVFGSQTPFYFSMSVTDFFSTIRTGAEMVILPKSYFSFPIRLIEMMNRYQVNTIYWVPSALCIVANLRLFKYARPEYLQKVLFAGEVMPVRQLNYWREAFPDLLYANLFGPTETTDICTYYVVNRTFTDGESLPIGNACDNCDVLVVDEDGKECAPGEEGELYVRGSFVAMGYYRNPEKTAEVFVQNPLQSAYPETVYRTGDIVRYNEAGELIYCGRKDFQIKRMGYRIELGEIENGAAAVEGVLMNACIYDPANDKIVMIYEGKAAPDEVLSGVKKRVPDYMVPNQVLKIGSMPYNGNGKIDRVWLKTHYTELEAK